MTAVAHGGACAYRDVYKFVPQSAGGDGGLTVGADEVAAWLVDAHGDPESLNSRVVWGAHEAGPNPADEWIAMPKVVIEADFSGGTLVRLRTKGVRIVAVLPRVGLEICTALSVGLGDGTACPRRDAKKRGIAVVGACGKPSTIFVFCEARVVGIDELEVEYSANFHAVEIDKLVLAQSADSFEVGVDEDLRVAPRVLCRDKKQPAYQSRRHANHAEAGTEID